MRGTKPRLSGAFGRSTDISSWSDAGARWSGSTAAPAETVRNRPYRGADCRAVRPVRLTSPGPADGLLNRSGMGIQSRHHHAERDLDGYFSPPEATGALLAIEYGRLPRHLWEPAASLTRQSLAARTADRAIAPARPRFLSCRT